MSTLTTIEKRYFEDLFGMDSGYVLNFSNDSFDEFFRTNFNIDIYDDKYSIRGVSKAKRLRAFWELEPDSIVGRALSEMLKIVEYNKHREGITEPDPIYDKCKAVVERLIDMPKHVISQEAELRIWGEGGYRVFLSHKANVKSKATALKEALSLFGITAFVAHKDVKPTKKWQDEIENALFSMDALVALMTKDFHESYWTDQEIGVAFGREIPIISIKLGQDPYGFIGKFQALSCSWDEAPL
jgi:hypothetical protein